MGLHLPKVTNILTDVGHGFKAAGDLGSYAAGAITGNNQAQANASAAYTNIGKAPAQQFTPPQNIASPKPNLLQRGLGDVGNFAVGLGQLPVQFSENYSNTFANLGAKAAGGKNQTIQQNMGGNTFLNNTLKFSGATGKNAQLAGDAAQIGLIVATGGAEAPAAAAGDNLAKRALGDAAPQIIKKIGGKAGALGARTVVNSASGATLNAIGAATNGASFKDTLKAAEQGAKAGALLTVAPEVAKSTVKAVKSVKTPAQVADTAASEYSGLHPSKVVNDNEAGTLSDYADTKTLNKDNTGTLYNPDVSTYNKLVMQARNAAKTAGIDITSGSNADISSRIAQYLEARDTHLSAKNAIGSGGYVGKGPLRDASGNEIPKLTAQEEAMGKALGMTEEETANAKAAMTTPADVPTLSDLSPEEQMKIFQGDEVPTHTLEENIAKNPYRDYNNISEVAAGDYEKARINGQQASNPVKVAAELAGQAAKRAGLTTTELARKVEGLDPIRNAKEQEAVDLTKELTGTALATSHSLGGNTETLHNYFPRAVDLPEEVRSSQSGGAGSETFHGINNFGRKFKTIDDLKNAGFNLTSEDPLKYLQDYGNRAGEALKRQAVFKGLVEADRNELNKTHTVDIGGLKSVQLSERGAREARSVTKQVSNQGVLGNTYDAANRGFKQVLLTLSEFHPINISVLKAGPALALNGHPLLAGKGVFDTFAAQVSPRYSEALQRSAQKDGVIEGAARIGTPIKFGSDFSKEGKLDLSKANLPEKLIFEHAMPAMHIQMVRGALEDLQKRGISFDSPEARELGTRVNEIMGFVNQEARNLDPRTQKLLQKGFLAPQFTRAKLATVKGVATDSGLARRYAAGAVAGNSAALFVTSAIGAAVLGGTQHDNIQDIILRSIFHPSVPTSEKDSKGNTIELGLPASYSSEVLNLLGFRLERGNDGHIHVSAKPGNVPGNVANYGRSRLAVIPNAGLKVATNTDFANKPLYDPNASKGTQAEQAATSLLTGGLPIGLQGVVHTKAVESHLPAASQEVLNASAPGSNPVVKSVASAFGATPRTDNTTGKGLQTTQYYNALDGAKKGLNRQEADALDVLTGSKKNPVTGKYDINKSVYDTPTKANLLLQNPKTLDALNNLNAKLRSQGQSTDPLYSLPKAQQVAYLQHETMLPGSAEAKQWTTDNASWYDGFTKDRSAYFNSLPAGDPNAPKDPIPYPNFTSQVSSDMDAYGNISDATAKAQYLDSHPDVTNAFNSISQYNNALRTARGAAALKGYPEADEQTTTDLKAYDNITDKSAKSAFLKSHQNVTDYFTNVALYGLEGEAATDRFVGNNPSQKELKDIYNLGNYDVQKNADGTYSLGSSTTGSNSSSYNYGIKNLGGYYASPSSVARGVAGVTKYAIREPSSIRYAKVTRGMRRNFSRVGPHKVKSKTLKAKAVKGTI
jgi:hypothetical protein